MVGSPPHMRGKVPSTGKHNNPLGITPAHAGKSPERGRFACGIRDHPRTCGEKVVNDLAGDVQKGSPPHMRGKD